MVSVYVLKMQTRQLAELSKKHFCYKMHDYETTVGRSG